MNFRASIAHFIRGLAMGAADVVPGVSGGTIAFISGIYEAFIAAVKSFDLALLRLLLKGEFRASWKHVNGALLLPLFLGIITSIVTLVQVITYLLENHPIPLWSFFGGLIFASAFMLMRELDSFHLRKLVWILVGAVFVAVISLAPPAAIPINSFTILVAGSIAICAMLLPGISGSFILLILGFYQATLTAVHDHNFAYLATFMAGAGIGFMLFSRLIHWLLNHHRNSTLGTMVGFLFGSLLMIWPWKQPTLVEAEAVRQSNVLPATFAQLGQDPQLLLAICSALAGIAIVAIIELLARRFANT